MVLLQTLSSQGQSQADVLSEVEGLLELCRAQSKLFNFNGL
jgi:hypothetical protein